MFHSTQAEQIAKVLKENHYHSVVVFCEYHGPGSFAGNHDPADTKQLTLFDVAPYKQGLLGPREYLKLFGHLDIAKFLGKFNWTKGFLEKVWNNEIDGITFEGVVGKAKTAKHHLIMSKAKTRLWIDKVKNQYSAEDAVKLINS